MSLIYTRLEQSGFLLETPRGARIAFDIGMATTKEVAGAIKADLQVISHVHGDHFWLDNVRALNTPVVAPSDVVAQLAAEDVRGFTIKAGDTFGFADASITAFTVDHGAISVPILNLGYVISVGNRTVFFAGDMKVGSLPPVAFDTILIPVGGNKVFSALEAVAYLEGVGFRGQVVPIHTEMAAEEGAAARFENAVGPGLKVLNLAVGAALEL